MLPKRVLIALTSYFIFIKGAESLRAQESPCYEFICGTNEAYLCGSDGVTYLNGCQYSQAQCKNPSLFVVSPGPCNETSNPPDETEVIDPAAPAPATPSEPSMVPTDCNDPFCSSEWKPVCGNDGITYSNPCQFSKAQCNNHGLLLKHNGRCKDHENCLHRICPMSEEPICASDGKTYRNDCEFDIAKCYDHELTPVASGSCPVNSTQPEGNCRDGPCEDQYRPVCATDGKTYPNICHFEKAKCKDKKLKIYKFEPCK